MKTAVMLLSLVLVVITATCNGGGGGSISTSLNSTVSGTLAWYPPTLYTDGSHISPGDLKGTNVYYSLGPSTCPTGSYYFVSAPTWSVSLQLIYNSNNLSSVATGTYEFSVTALDQNDMESDCSNTVSAAF